MGFFDDFNAQMSSPTGMALAQAAENAGQMAMPSRYKVPFGAVLAHTMAGYSQGLQAQQKAQQEQQATQMGQMNLNYTQMTMPMKMQAMQQYLANPDAGNNDGSVPFGMPSTSAPVVQQSQPQRDNGLQNPGIEGDKPISWIQALAKSEGGNDPKAIGDGGKAVGLFQFHPEAAEEMGLSDRTDSLASAIAAQKYAAKYGANTPNPSLYGTVAFKAGPKFAKTWDGNISSIPQPAQDSIIKMNNMMGGSLFGNQQSGSMGSQPDQHDIEIAQAKQEVRKNQMGAIGGLPGSQESLTAAQTRLTNAIKAKSDLANTLASQQHEADLAGTKKAAETKASDVQEAGKQLSAVNSSIDSQIENLRTLEKLSKRMPDRGPADVENFVSKHFGSQDTSSAWNEFNTLNKQMFVNGLMGSIPPGSRLDIPIVNALKGAKEVDPYTDAKSRNAVIESHLKMLQQAKKNAENNYSMMLGNPTNKPTSDSAPSKTIHFNDLPD